VYGQLGGVQASQIKKIRLCAAGRSCVGNISFGKPTWHVREEWSRPSSASTLRVVMRLCWMGGVSSAWSGSLKVSVINLFIGLLPPKSVVRVSQRPPFEYSSNVSKS
jgi:hypothetical protein